MTHKGMLYFSVVAITPLNAIHRALQEKVHSAINYAKNGLNKTLLHLDIKGIELAIFL